MLVQIGLLAAELRYENSCNCSLPSVSSDSDAWEKKIGTELQRINAVLNQEKWDDSNNSLAKIQPEDTELDQMLEKRRNQILENEIYDARDPNRITTLTQLTNIRKILELISDVATQLRRTTESYKTNEI